MTSRFVVFVLAGIAGCSAFTNLDQFSEPDPVVLDGGATATDGPTTSDGSSSGSNGGDGATTDGSGCVAIPDVIAHWSFDQGTVTSDTVLDRSSAGADLSKGGTGMLGTTPGKLGDALQFPTNGGAWLTVPNLAFDANAGASNTFALWIFRPAGNALDDVVLYAPSDPRYDLWFTANAGHDHLCLDTGNYDCWGVQDDTLRGRWVHVAVVLANGPITSSSLYVDGVKRTVACQTGGVFLPCDATRTIGGPVVLGGDTTFPFRGKMDDARFYRRALSDAEVKALYEGRACD